MFELETTPYHNESYWEDLIEQEITCYPKLKENETFQQFYQRLHQDIIQPINELTDINDPLSAGRYRGYPPLHAVALCEIVLDKISDKLLNNNQLNVDKLDKYTPPLYIMLCNKDMCYL